MSKKIIYNILKFLVSLVIGILIIGSIVQYNYDSNVKANHEPKGQFVELAGTNMHYRSLGSGTYTLVLEAGLGENMLTWSKIEDSLSQISRVFMYDRAGLGYSDFNNTPRTSSQIAKELKQLLNKANIPGPYILVGHSIGGAHLRYFAHLYPENIEGLFLIDPSHEKMVSESSKSNILDSFYLFSLKHLSKTGIPFFIMPNFLHPINKTSKNIKAYGYETESIDDSMAELRNTNIYVSHLPIYIISARHKQEKTAHSAYLQELVDDSQSDIKKLVEYQKPHYIHITDPDIIINHLKEFLMKLDQSSILNSTSKRKTTPSSVIND